MRTVDGLQIYPPRNIGDKFTVVDPVGGMKYGMPFSAINILLQFQDEKESEDSAEFAELVRLGLISTSRGPFASNVQRLWKERNWTEALGYVESSYDYPCVDYGSGGYLADRQRMRDYVGDEPEPERYKRPREAVLKYLPTFAESVERLSRPERGLNELNLETLLSLLAAPSAPRKASNGRPDYVVRTSPSGGGRSSTELYFLPLDVETFEPAWYHVGAEDPSPVRRVSLSPPSEDLLELFPAGIGRRSAPPRVLLALTAVFERNMYRYREPRTFRTVHMDAGHMIGSALIVAKDLGMVATFATSDNGQGIEASLNLNGLVEGHMATVAIS